MVGLYVLAIVSQNKSSSILHDNLLGKRASCNLWIDDLVFFNDNSPSL